MGLCCAAVRSAQFCYVCVGQVDFLTNETDARVFFHREQEKHEETEKERAGGEGGET